MKLKNSRLTGLKWGWVGNSATLNEMFTDRHGRHDRLLTRWGYKEPCYKDSDGCNNVTNFIRLLLEVFFFLNTCFTLWISRFTCSFRTHLWKMKDTPSNKHLSSIQIDRILILIATLHTWDGILIYGLAISPDQAQKCMLNGSFTEVWINKSINQKGKARFCRNLLWHF